MKFLPCFAILYFLGAAFAVEKEILIKFHPITTEQYESLLEINAGKPVISEGRLINSAITGLAGLATGFQVGKLLPDLLGGNNNQNFEGTVAGYPMCTINSNEPTARQIDGASYINMEQLTEALAHPGSDAKGLPVINCVLILDDGKGQHPDHPTYRPTHRPPRPTTTTTTTPAPTTTPKPRPPHHATEAPIYRPHPHPPHHHPWYPRYPSYPYPPPLSYHPYPPPPHHAYPPPPPYYYPYIKYPVNHNYEEYDEHGDEDYESPTEAPVQLPTISIHSFLLDKLQSLHETSTTTTTRRPTRRPNSRPTRRPHSQYPTIEYKSQQITNNDDLDEYDDSVDYIEVSKNVH